MSCGESGREDRCARFGLWASTCRRPESVPPASSFRVGFDEPEHFGRVVNALPEGAIFPFHGLASATLELTRLPWQVLKTEPPFRGFRPVIHVFKSHLPLPLSCHAPLRRHPAFNHHPLQSWMHHQ